jgi:hypothetical protein
MALAATSACLGLGLLMSFLVTGPVAEVAVALVWTGIGLLLLVPVGNVISVFVDEWRQTPRTFAWAALAVLALLAGTIATRF